MEEMNRQEEQDVMQENEGMEETEVKKKEELQDADLQETRAEDANVEEGKKEAKADGNDKKKSPAKNNSGKKNRKSIKGLEMELKAQSEIIDDLSAKMKAAQEVSEQATDKYQRLMAEFENMRKRTEKESMRMYDIGAKEVLEKLLPIIDNFERAQMSLTDEQKEDPFVQGVDKIYRQLLDYLTAVKVTPMEAEGKEFDPELHNAVMHIEDDTYNDNVVLEELQKGYMYKEEVLRHSMVKVAN